MSVGTKRIIKIIPLDMWDFLRLEILILRGLGLIIENLSEMIVNVTHVRYLKAILVKICI